MLGFGGHSVGMLGFGGHIDMLGFGGHRIFFCHGIGKVCLSCYGIVFDGHNSFWLPQKFAVAWLLFQ